MAKDTCAEEFERHRSYLGALAYRMLGSVSEAEDAVQEAFLRWHQTHSAEIDNPQAYLSRITTRLCLDQLKLAHRKREVYVGPWLPEPLVEAEADSTQQLAEEASYALLLALERLSPPERAAFILHDLFDLDYPQVAAALERSEASCRQLCSRARARVKEQQSRFAPAPQEARSLCQAFFQASRSGDTQQLQSLLASGARFHSDGGGKRSAALRTIFGREKICRLFAGLARKLGPRDPLWQERVTINGLPGVLTLEADGHLQTLAIEAAHGAIDTVYVVRNPEKLAHLVARLPAELRPRLASATQPA